MSSTYLIGARRALKSPGFFANRQKKLGARRILAAVTKAAHIGLTLVSPLGIKCELLQRKLVAPSGITQERLGVAQEFLRVFANPEAREFVFRQKVENYTDAIMANHPRATELDKKEISRKCQALVKAVFRRLEDVQQKPEFLFDILASMSRTAAAREGIWFPEYLEAYGPYKGEHKLAEKDEMFFPEIVGDSLVDIGCGSGSLLAYVKRKHGEQIVRTAGIDVVNRLGEGVDIEFFDLDFSRPGTVFPGSEKFATGMLIAVLHHAAKTEQEAATFLTGVKTAVTTRLIVEEDAIVTPEDLQKSYPGMAELPAVRNRQRLAEEYIGLSPKTQKDINIIDDVLANALSVGVPEMAFAFGFRSITEWVELFKQNGFALNKVKIVGFQEENFNPFFRVNFILDVKS